MGLDAYLVRLEMAEDIYANRRNQIFSELVTIFHERGFGLPTHVTDNYIQFAHKKLEETIIAFDVISDVDIFLDVLLNNRSIGKIKILLESSTLRYCKERFCSPKLIDTIDQVFAKI